MRRFDEAHAALDRALELSPNDEGALANKASLFQAEGRWDAAARELARIPADSTDEFVAATRVGQEIAQGHFEAAIALIEPRTVAAKPGEPLNTTAKAFLTQLGYCHEWAGHPEKARSTFMRAVQAIKPSPETVVVADSLGLPQFLALAYAGLGNKEKALEQAKRAVSDYETDAVNKPNAEATRAQIQARFGDLDSAIAIIPHLLEVTAGITPADLRTNPLWNPLRKDPRFARLMAEPQTK
jgi:tetratricopeptide (TPR) repeat protein